MLAKFLHIESIPAESRDWGVNAFNASTLARTLVDRKDDALLFRKLATLRTDIPLFDDVDELRWTGPRADFPALAARFDRAVVSDRDKRRAAPPTQSI